MLTNTRAAIDGMISEFKLFSFIFSVISQMIFILSLTYSLALSKGNLAVNIVLLSLSVIFFVIYVICHNRIDKKSKMLKDGSERVYKAFKFANKTVSLAVTVYSIYCGTADMFTLFLSVFMTIFWFIDLLTMLLIHYLSGKKELLLESIQMDFEDFVRPVKVARDFVTHPVKAVKKLITDDEPEEEESRLRKRIKKMAAGFKAKKAKEKENARHKKKLSKIESDSEKEEEIINK